MRVLLCQTDLYASTGGGQTFYRLLVEKNPDIQFYYLCRKESLNLSRPKNAFALPEKFFPRIGPEESLALVECLNSSYQEPIVAALTLASSVQGMSFDIVDSADYFQHGAFLRPAFEQFGVTVGRIALAMHGNVSTSYAFDWGEQQRIDPSTMMLEQWQFQCADIRYGISRSYINEWRTLTGIEAFYLSPLGYLPRPTPSVPARSSIPPTLYCIGRTERLKGADVFIDVVSQLPRASFSRAEIIGPPTALQSGGTSHDLLRNYAKQRNCDVSLRAELDSATVHTLFRERCVVLLPSRYDTLNLVALEALFAGCPTVIGTPAGVTRLLEDELPTIPHLRIDPEHSTKTIPALVELLQNYDHAREGLARAVEAIGSYPTAKPMMEVYARPSTANKEYQAQARATVASILPLIDGITYPRRVKLNLVGHRLGEALLDAREDRSGTPPPASPWCAYVHYRELRELSEELVNNKITQAQNLSETIKVDRVRMWRELARLERLRGQELVAATYGLRVLRALDEDRFHDLPWIIRALEASGFSREAHVANLMFGDTQHRHADMLAFLDERFVEGRTALSNHDLALYRDCRPSGTPRVSVIVSLYRAASKLAVFLERLAAQTLIARGELEIILVDSASPTDEQAELEQFLQHRPLPVLYVRTVERETIQKAWNRGIGLSRGAYLAFLGADEAVVPHAFEQLAQELDSEPALDWVTGSSQITEVSASGSWIADGMLYDRRDYRQDLAYLDTSYLSWVGALYRRSIHDRFGYYDSSFRAAGDTEFKNRVLPHIRSKSIPGTLGIFLNYPEERTTASPVAEVEDLRAWYLHRTQAGVAYAFRERSTSELAQMIRAALAYKKCYTTHGSSDFSFAHSLVCYASLSGRVDGPIDALRPEISESHRMFIETEYLGRVGALSHFVQEHVVRERLRAIEASHRAKLGNSHVRYELFNDNRYEQHFWAWRMTDKAFKTKQGHRIVWR